MDTNVIGRKKNDIAAIDGERPDIHQIYVRSLSEATHGNAAGIGLASLCHRRVIEEMNVKTTRMNCITASHITCAMTPVDFPNDRQALAVSCQLAGYLPPEKVKAMWIPNTLHLEQVECSQAFWEQAQQRDNLQVLTAPRSLQFDSCDDLLNFESTPA